MGKLKALAGALGAAAILLTLVGCGGTPVPADPEKPISVEEAGYEEYYTQLPGLDVNVGCFEHGSGNTRVLTCFEASKDIPKDELLDFDTLGFSKLSFVDASRGDTLACIEDGSGKTSVLTCFTFESESSVASEQ